MISNCPKCTGQVTMPGDGKADWQVKCPLCEQQFSLGEMLEKLPPALIVISAPSANPMAAPLATKADDDFAAIFAGEAEGTTGGDIFELDTADGETPSFIAADSSAGPALATAPSKAAITTLPRRKKKEKSIVNELLKIVLGGAAGLLIGYFLLLWVWKKDVLTLAPKFPSWAQWALPADLKKAAPTVTPASTVTANANNTEPKTDESTDQESPDEMPKDDTGEKTDVPETPKDGEKTDDVTPTDDATAKTDDEKPAESDTPKETPKEDEPSITEKPADDPAADDKAKKEKPIDQDDPLDVRPPDADKKSDLPSIDEPKIEDPFKPKTPDKEPLDKESPPDEKKPADTDKPEITDPLPDVTEDKKPDDKKKPDEPSPKEDPADKEDTKPDESAEVGLKISEKSTPEQIETALAAASDAEKILTPTEAAQKSAFTPEKYAAFGKVCEAVAAMTRSGDETVSDDKLKITVLLVTDDDEHAAVIGQLANAWLSRARKNDGIVLVGKVEEVSGEGPLKTVKVQLPALGLKLPASQISIVAKELPELKPQDTVNVTGVIVEKPAEAINGYKGENTRVVWATNVTKRDTSETIEKPADEK
jgi:hypothetical protein